jgi:AraC-like DNA-binding protein
MPLFMDVHIIPGIKARDVAEAHRKDVQLQEEHHCKCMTYWIDEERENVFCLIDAPDKECVVAMHHKAHGLVPNKIIEVNPELVQSFLGRLYDPEHSVATDDGLKVFHDPSFRIILFISIKDPVLLRHELGIEKANGLLSNCTTLIRQQLNAFDGREVEHPGNGFLASFTAASRALSCALAILQLKSEVEAAELKIAVNAGEPIAKVNHLFGDTIQFARQLCFITNASKIAVASLVKELTIKDHFQRTADNIIILVPQDEVLLDLLFNKLEENWQNPDFTVSEFCQAMAMSQSQLYRRTIELTGKSPNVLLKEFRLEKAKELMNKQRYNISQITFDTGFTSPSYFTKCFKSHYGLLPMAYLELLR